MNKKVALALCGSVLLCGSSVAEDRTAQDPGARLEAVARSYTGDNAFMGTVLVAKGDQLLLNKGYGQADLEWSIPNAPEVKFRLGSLTKQFTATLVLLLQQEGKLNVSDPVSKYLPDSPKAWEKITLAELLGHTSGIPNFTSLKEFGTWRMTAHTAAEELAFFRDKPLEFEPGSKFAYSNSNYEVLGAVIEKVSGKTYGEMLEERIFGPVGMKSTGLDADELILPKRAQGYVPGPHGLAHAVSESMTVPWAAGSVYSTTGDLLLWEHALFGHKVLNDASLKLMTTPGKGGYGFGLFMHQEEGVTVVDHGGGIEGFNTSLAYVPERGIAVIVLANVNGDAADDMGAKLLKVALGEQVTLATERKSVPIDKAELAKFVGTYQLTPTFSVAIAAGPDGLTVQGSGQPAMPLFYEGAEGGHPRFYVKTVDAEIEFIPDASGAIHSLILHQGGQDISGKRQ